MLGFLVPSMALPLHGRGDSLGKVRTVYALTPDTTGLDMDAPPEIYTRCLRGVAVARQRGCLGFFPPPLLRGITTVADSLGNPWESCAPRMKGVTRVRHVMPLWTVLLRPHRVPPNRSFVRSGQLSIPGKGHRPAWPSATDRDAVEARLLAKPWRTWAAHRSGAWEVVAVRGAGLGSWVIRVRRSVGVESPSSS